MKKIFFCVIFVLIFNISVLCCCLNKNNLIVKSEYFYNKSYKLCSETENIKNDNIFFKTYLESYNLTDFKNGSVSKLQSNIINEGFNKRVEVLNFALNNSFTKKEAVFYAFPEVIELINFIKHKYCYEPKNAEIKAKPNTGEIYIKQSECGLNLDENALIMEFFNKIMNNDNQKYIDLRFFETFTNIDYDYFSKNITLKSSFKTDFSSSISSRKNNIKKAMSSIDGVVLYPDEVFSFNKTTGVRNEKNGYMKAKTIKNGSYFEEYGGGVCQVSTTLYNAALLADLEILEVNPHSLPVSYIEPCFDAMVNEGSSDLLIKNNTELPIIIACSNKNDQCLINIYGIKNKFNIKRIGKKIEEIENNKFEKIYDYQSVGFDKPIDKGKQVVISKGKNGYKATGYLEYYKNDVLIKTKNIRSNTYYPTKEVILVG